MKTQWRRGRGGGNTLSTKCPIFIKIHLQHRYSIIIIWKSYYSAHIYQQGTQGAEYYTCIYIQIFRKIGCCSDEFLKPNYLARHKGLQGAKAHTAATARNTGENPFSEFSVRDNLKGNDVEGNYVWIQEVLLTLWRYNQHLTRPMNIVKLGINNR